MTKNKLKFLYIVDKFPPAGMQAGIRALELSKEMVKENILPIILTKKFKKNELYNIQKIKEIPKELKIYRTHFCELKIKNKLILKILEVFRFDYYLEWIPFGYFKAKNLISKNNFKFIYASGPPFYTHILAYLLNKKFSIPIILEYRDPWSFNPYGAKKLMKYVNRKINFLVEKKCLKLAELIITVSNPLKKFLIDKFKIKPKKIVPIPNGIDLNYNDFKSEKKKNELTLVFAGTLYSKRTIVPFLKILAELNKENFFDDFPVKIKIFGKYNKGKLSKIAKKFRIDQMILLGEFLPRSKVKREIINGDLAIHIGEKINYPTIAFKVWDYLSCGKKILYFGNKKSYTSKFIKKNHLGYIIPINDLLNTKKEFKTLCAKIKSNEYSTSIEKKEFESYSWKKRAEKLVKVIKFHFY